MWLFFLPSGFVRYYVISNLTPAANSRRSRGKGEENLFFCEKIISSSSNSKSTWTRYIAAIHLCSVNPNTQRQGLNSHENNVGFVCCTLLCRWGICQRQPRSRSMENNRRQYHRFQ